MVDRTKVRFKDVERELIIGVIEKPEGQAASGGYDVFARWDEEMIKRKLKAKIAEKFYNDFDYKPFMADYKNLRRAFHKFVELMDVSVAEMVDDFGEEVNAKKVK